MKHEESMKQQNAVVFDPENPPEGFISIDKAVEKSRSWLLRIGLGAGLILSVGGIIILQHRKKSLEIS